MSFINRFGLEWGEWEYMKETMKKYKYLLLIIGLWAFSVGFNWGFRP
jgi:hypothetical protein